MFVKIWGGRGSLPSPLTPEAVQIRIQNIVEGFLNSGHKDKAEVQAYLNTLPFWKWAGFGGNTSCIEVKTPEQQIIVDAGSGIRLLGYELLKGPCGHGKGEVHILFTHFHWDHVLGLPFFVPIFIPGNKIHVYAVQQDLKAMFQTVFQKPFFPVALQNIGAQIIYHQLEPRKTVEFSNIHVTPYQLDHPDPCWGYKFEHVGKIFSYCVDTECTRMSREKLGVDLPLYQGVDLMLFDAQYTLLETIDKINWGHAAASIGLDLAMREGIKRVRFIHHDPASSDEKIATAEAETRRYYENQLKTSRQRGIKVYEVDWSFAYEGMCLEV